MNEAIVSGNTVTIRDRNTGDITAWTFSDNEMALAVAQASASDVFTLD